MTKKKVPVTESEILAANKKANKALMAAKARDMVKVMAPKED